MQLPDYVNWSAEERHQAKIQGIFRHGDYPGLDKVFDDILPLCPQLLEEVLQPYAGDNIQQQLHNMYVQDTLPVFETAGFNVSREASLGNKQLGKKNFDSWHAFNLVWNPKELGKNVMEKRMK